jgi:hypothetical protein
VKKRKTLLMAVMMMGTLLLGACGGNANESSDDTSEPQTQETAGDETEGTETEETETEEIGPEGMYRSELTNEWIDESLKDQRPIAVMVDNEKKALPHYGLTQADVVYEMMNSLLNGRITRFMALVKDWGSLEQFGSIRSARTTNFMIAPEWNAVVCHDGGPFYINPYLELSYVDNFSGTFSRVDNGKATEYTEYILAGDLEKNFESKGLDTTYNEYYPGAHYQFANEKHPVELEGDSAIEAYLVDFPFQHNETELHYDEDTQLYYYYEYGEAHLDPANDNAQLCFKNVLIQKCDYIQYDENGYMGFEVKVSDQEGYYVTNGNAIPVTWTKTSDTEPTRYYYEDGTEITINTGKTYIAFVPSDDWDDLVITGK